MNPPHVLPEPCQCINRFATLLTDPLRLEVPGLEIRQMWAAATKPHHPFYLLPFQADKHLYTTTGMSPTCSILLPLLLCLVFVVSPFLIFPPLPYPVPSPAHYTSTLPLSTSVLSIKAPSNNPKSLPIVQMLLQGSGLHLLAGFPRHLTDHLALCVHSIKVSDQKLSTSR